MKAAVLHTLGESPRFEDFPDPVAHSGEVIVGVRAASLKNIDKALASGRHYARHAHLPAVCGVDGVGVLDDGARVFCGGSRAPYGMMAERTVVSRLRCLPIPDAVDDVTAAALPNPALSSWLPLVWRAQLKRGETVLILGATGVAGKLAIQIAKHLGAGRVVAQFRNRDLREWRGRQHSAHGDCRDVSKALAAGGGGRTSHRYRAGSSRRYRKCVATARHIWSQDSYCPVVN